MTTPNNINSNFRQIAVADAGGNVYGVNISNVGNLQVAGGTSGQVLTTDGAGTLSWTSAPKSYLMARRNTTDQTLGTGTDLIFNQNVASSGITYDTATGIATLAANKTYLLSADCAWYGFSDTVTGFVDYSWVDSTNTIIAGAQRGVVLPVNRNATESFVSQTRVIITTTASTTVKVRCVSGSGTAAMRANYSSMVITEL